jgi:hypothetical protein
MGHDSQPFGPIFLFTTRDGTRRVWVRVEPSHTCTRRFNLTRHPYPYPQTGTNFSHTRYPAG